MRRRLLGCLALLAATGCAAQTRSVAAGGASIESGAKITLLGTAGGPPPHRGESQPASLLVVDGKAYLIDAGENAGQQLLKAGVTSQKLDAAFVTHLHWDHTLGLDYLMATGWMNGRRSVLPILGPPGLGKFVRLELAAVGLGENIFRAQADSRPKLSSLYAPREIAACAPAEVYKDATVTVTASCNSHFAHVRAKDHEYGADRALSYRFDTKYGAITFTGDTGPSEAVERLAKDSDVLVSEIVDLPSMEKALAFSNSGKDLDLLMSHMKHQHLTPGEVGKLATRAGVRKLVLTHFVYGPGFRPEEFKAQVARHYAGEIIVAKDLETVSLAARPQ